MIRSIARRVGGRHPSNPLARDGLWIAGISAWIAIAIVITYLAMVNALIRGTRVVDQFRFGDGATWETGMWVAVSSAPFAAAATASLRARRRDLPWRDVLRRALLVLFVVDILLTPFTLAVIAADVL